MASWLSAFFSRLFKRKRIRERFTTGESLDLYTEALEVLQSYHAEPDPKKLEEAARDLKTCLEKYPDDLLPMFYLGLVRVEQGYPGLDEAERLFKKVRSSADRALSLDATYNLALTNVERYTAESFEEARRLLDDAIETAATARTPESVALMLQAKALLLYIDSQSLFWSLTRAAKRAHRIDEELDQLHEEFAGEELAEDAKRDFEAEYWNAKGIVAQSKALSTEDAAERRAHNLEAKEHYEEALRHKTDWVASLSNLAVLHQRRLGEPETAIEIWGKVLKIRPDDEYANFQLGKFHHGRDPAKAAAHYKLAPNIREAAAALKELEAK